MQRFGPALASLSSFGGHGGVGQSCDKTNVVIVMQLISARFVQVAGESKFDVCMFNWRVISMLPVHVSGLSGRVECWCKMALLPGGMSCSEEAGYRTASSGHSLTVSEHGETGACSEVS